MKETTRKIYYLFSQGLIYSAGNMLLKLVLFLSVPIYAYYIRPEDLSLLEILDPAEQFVLGIAKLGLVQGLYRYYSKFETRAWKSDVVSTLFWFTVVSALGWSVIFGLLTPLIVPALLPEHPLAYLCFYLAVASFALRFLTLVPSGYLIITEQALRQTWLRLAGGILFIGYLAAGIIYFGGNIESAFIGRLFLFVPIIGVGLYNLMPYLRFRFNWSLFKPMLLFSLPFVLASAAYPILNFFDRWLLSVLVDAETTGIYGMSYRFGMIPGMILVAPFLKAWRPFIYNYDDSEHQEVIYTRVMLYYTLFGCLLWLGLSVFSEEIIMIFTASDYYEGHMIIPYVAASQFFYGLGWILFAGLAIQEKSLFIGVISMGAALLNIALNFILIPMLGMLGAAIATFLAFFLMFAAYSVYVHYHLRIRWPYLRFVGMLTLSLLAFGVVLWLEPEITIVGIAVKLLVCFAAGLILFYATGLKMHQLTELLKSSNKS